MGLDVPRPVIASKNDKLELQDCLEFNRTAKMAPALCAWPTTWRPFNGTKPWCPTPTRLPGAGLPLPHTQFYPIFKYRVGEVLDKQK